jgi:SPP1 gp7 family putative phage head morphogenesis protein
VFAGRTATTEPKKTDAGKASARLLKGARNRPISDYLSSRFPDSFDFPWNPDDLARGNSYEIYDEMRDDDQVKAVLSIKKQIAISTGYEVVSDSDEVREFFRAEFENLHSLDDGFDSSMDDVLRDMLSCLDYGFSLTEPVYKLRDDGRWGIKSLKTRPPHSFEFNVDHAGNVTKVTQEGKTSRKDFDPAHFVHLAYQSDFGNPYGKSDLRSAFAPWKAKKFMDRFYAIYMERYAAPFVVGRYPKGMSEEEIAALHAMIKDVQITTGMTLPDDVSLDIVETSKDASEAFERALNHYNLRIARAILVPDLLGQAGEKTTGGSFALGETHFKMFLGLIQTLRRMVARKITSKLIRPLVLVNFGAGVDAEFKFLPFTEDLLVDHFKTWADAVTQLKVKPTLEQVNHLNKALGFPESEEDSMAPVEAAAREAEAGADGAEADASAPRTPPKSPANGPGARPKAKMGRERAKTDYEAKMDFAAVEASLDEAEESVLGQLSQLCAKTEGDFLELVADSGLYKRQDASRLNALGFRFLREHNSAWGGYFEGLFSTATEEAAKEILPRGTFKSPVLPERFLAIIRAEAFKVVKEWNDLLSKRAKNIILQGMKDGLAEAEAFRTAKAAMRDESDRWVRTVVRTKTTEVYNEARKIYFETDPIASEIVVAYQWSAILDDRTSGVCRMLDGRIWKVGEYADRVKPPAHFNCRSILVPVTRFEKFDESKRVSLDAIREAGGNLILPPSGKSFTEAG